MDKWQEMEKRYFLRTVARWPVTIVRGKGAYVWDVNGKKYLDFVCGWATNCLGHCHPAVTRSLKKQAGILIQTSNQFYTLPQLNLAEMLINNSCFDRVFFANSGTEANEAAVKLARRHGKLKLNGAYEVITAIGSFHGRTLAMVAATGQKKFQDPYTPLPEGFVNVAYGDVEAVKRATSSKTCAVLMEPIQGESGVNMPSESYFQELQCWCEQNGLLLMLDEVQTGLGRTGALFAFQHYGIEPDVITLAKGLGNGVPIGALLAKEKASVFSPGEHSSTFGGNPLTCAAAHATVGHIIEHDLVRKVKEIGEYFLYRLNELKNKFPIVTECRGKGLLLAIEFSQDIAEKVALGCLSEGLLLNRVKPNALRFMPPYIITKDQIEKALSILSKVLELEK